MSTRRKWCAFLPPTHRFFPESALWYSFSEKLNLTPVALQRVAQIKGKQEEDPKLSMEVRTRDFL